MSYIGNNQNRLLAAIISATNIVPSTAIYRTDRTAKNGGGTVRLDGEYTGQRNSDFDIEIVDTTGSSDGISAPEFSGIGNGELGELSATDVVVQEFTVTLQDPGTRTRKAYAQLQGVTIQAKTAGDDGNLISLSINHAGVTNVAETSWSLRFDLRQGSNAYVGDEWNFNAATLTPEGDIPADAPRIRFGSDPQIYRPFRKYEDGHYVYGFSPAPVRDVLAGAVVHVVTGTHSLTVTQVADPDPPIVENYPGLVTLFDALSALAASDLVEVPITPVNSRKPGDMGSVELSEWTTSYVLGIVADGSVAVRSAELNIVASSSAPTEDLKLTCTRAPATGHEIFKVEGSVSGRLDDAETGVPYAMAGYEFTIPLPQVPGGGADGETTGDINVTFDMLDRAPPYPTFCADKADPHIGSAAQNGRISFTYTQRPPADCPCDGVVYEGGPSEECLGVPITGGQPVSVASRLIRVQRLATAVAGFVGSNTSPQYTAAAIDIPWIEGSAAILKEALDKIGSAPDVPEWADEHEYAIDAIIVPQTDNGSRYAVDAFTGDAATSGTTEPTFTATAPDLGDTVTDGTITWRNIGPTAWAQWDEYFEAWKDEMATLAGVGSVFGSPVADWSPEATPDFFQNTGGPMGFNGKWCVPTTRNGYLYFMGSLATPCTTDASEPTWPEPGSIREGIPIAPNTTPDPILWSSFGPYWEATEGVSEGAIINPGTDSLWIATATGTTGATEPDFYAAGPITDGTVEWTRATSSDLPPTALTTMDLYFQKWKTQMEEVKTFAGLDASFNSAGVNGDGCWTDHPDAGYWWVEDSGRLLPAFTNVYYHAATRTYDENGEPYYATTHEFGFMPAIACSDSLTPGDKFYIDIRNVVGSSTGQGYQPGDNWVASMTHAEPIPLGGGQTGNDRQIWSVVGSEDGPLDEYELSLVTPNAYSESAGAGTLGFQITQGGIEFAIGDAFAFSIEGGHFRWRRDGGAWSSSLPIADTLLADGLTAQFIGGTAPSWQLPDAWSFEALAENGPDQLRQPTDGECAWTGSTVIEITPSGDSDITGVLIANHRIPSDAVITLTGSDDNFSTTPVNQVIPWKAGSIYFTIAADRAKYRLSVNTEGAIFWLNIGPHLDLFTPGGANERGKIEKVYRMPGFGVREGLGIDIVHEWVSQDSLANFRAMLSHACANDDRRFAVVPNFAEDEVAIVEFLDDALRTTDRQSYQPRATSYRKQGLSLTLSAIA